MTALFDIWAAGVDILTTCIRHGLVGRFDGLGESAIFQLLSTWSIKQLEGERWWDTGCIQAGKSSLHG